MAIARRTLLKACLGATQFGLLSSLLSGRAARAQSAEVPTKLLTFFLSGGWMPLWAFCPLSPEEITRYLPRPTTLSGEPVYFDANQVVALDGSGATGAVGGVQPLRTPALWDEAALAAGSPDPRTGGLTSPHGWSWKHHRLWENTLVVHGVDQMSAAHVSAQVSALCGVASSDFKSPSVQALAAHHLFDAHPDRPLPFVWISGTPRPAALSLRPEATPLRIAREADIDLLYSMAKPQAWAGLKASDIGSTLPPRDFSGAALNEGFNLNPMEDWAMRRARRLGQGAVPSMESAMQAIHDNLLGVSRTLAADVASRVARTQAFEHTPQPYWIPAGNNPYATDVRIATDNGANWKLELDLALKLLKSDVTTSIAVECLGANRFGFDMGHSVGHEVEFVHCRGVFDLIGRFLGEMKATPGRAAGRSLLDDTLVLILSDFSRTWPSAPTCDHWPTTSVIFAGGGINSNRMIGTYDVASKAPGLQGYLGAPIDIQESSGLAHRVPRSADIVTTALAVLGISGIRIPGGNGEIVGVRAGS